MLGLVCFAPCRVDRALMLATPQRDAALEKLVERIGTPTLDVRYGRCNSGRALACAKSKRWPALRRNTRPD
jgi:hypothetical protein